MKNFNWKAIWSEQVEIFFFCSLHHILGTKFRGNLDEQISSRITNNTNTKQYHEIHTILFLLCIAGCMKLTSSNVNECKFYEWDRVLQQYNLITKLNSTSKFDWNPHPGLSPTSDTESRKQKTERINPIHFKR